jgi:hypothetical protein
LLKKYEGQIVGINHDETGEMKGATLAQVGEDHFTVIVPENKLVYTFPLANILSIVEGLDGVETGDDEGKRTFPALIHVYCSET